MFTYVLMCVYYLCVFTCVSVYVGVPLVWSDAVLQANEFWCTGQLYWWRR